MKDTDFIGEQIWFETTRLAKDGQSLWEYNHDLSFLVERIAIELLEAHQAIKDGQSPRDITMEFLDVDIFLDSAKAHLAAMFGYSIEDIERMKAEKMNRNYEKYTEQNFAQSETPREGIIYSREKWNK